MVEQQVDERVIIHRPESQGSGYLSFFLSSALFHCAYFYNTTGIERTIFQIVTVFTTTIVFGGLYVIMRILERLNESDVKVSAESIITVDSRLIPLFSLLVNIIATNSWNLLGLSVFAFPYMSLPIYMLLHCDIDPKGKLRDILLNMFAGLRRSFAPAPTPQLQCCTMPPCE